MIEVLLFTLCVPVMLGGTVVDYDCSYDIVFVEFQGMMKHLHEYYGGDEDQRRHNLAGLWAPSVKTIYLWKGHEGDYAMTGCTVLWHEILHAYGVSEEEMPLTVDGKCPRR